MANLRLHPYARSGRKIYSRPVIVVFGDLTELTRNAGNRGRDPLTGSRFAQEPDPGGDSGISRG